MRAARLTAPLAFALAFAVFAALVLDLVLGGPVATLDRAGSEWFRGLCPPWATSVLAAVSTWHRPRVIFAATAAVALLLAWRREWRGLWLVLLAVPGGAALNSLVKHACARPRPSFGLQHLATADFAFPSGHVANATVLYGALTLLLLRHHRHGRVARGVVVGLAAIVVATVALSRLVLGAHHPGDVLAGAALGLAWLALCAMVVRPPVCRPGDDCR